MVANQEGAARIKATYRSISSDDGEATSYVPLYTNSPDYEIFLKDLISADQGA